MNVISWFESASLFTFPRHTFKTARPAISVMYITDTAPSISSQSGLRGWLGLDLERVAMCIIIPATGRGINRETLAGTLAK